MHSDILYEQDAVLSRGAARVLPGALLVTAGRS
jgi:hypothetical protein